LKQSVHTVETSIPAAAAAVKHTQRARSPDPQARGPLSQWTEAWPTQPAITQTVNRRRAGEGETLPPNVTHISTDGTAVSSCCRRGSAHARVPRCRLPREQQRDSPHVHRPGAPQHPCRKHRRAPGAGEVTDSRSGFMRLSPTPRHLGQEILEGGGSCFKYRNGAPKSLFRNKTPPVVLADHVFCRARALGRAANTAVRPSRCKEVTQP